MIMEDLVLFQEFLKWKTSISNSQNNQGELSSSAAPAGTSGSTPDQVVGNPSHSHCPTAGTNNSEMPSPSAPVDPADSTFTADEYLALTKGRGKKVTVASKNFHHILKVAAQEANIWGKGVSLSQVTPAQRKYVHKRVIGECSSLKGHSREIDAQLGRALCNSNYYQAKKMGKKSGKGGSKKKTNPESLVKDKDKTKANSSDKPKLNEYDIVTVLHEGKEIASAVFISEIPPGCMYCRLKLVKLFPIHSRTEVNLPEPVEGKDSIWELEENDEFLWKIKKIKKSTKRIRQKKNFDDYY